MKYYIVLIMSMLIMFSCGKQNNITQSSISSPIKTPNTEIKEIESENLYTLTDVLTGNDGEKITEEFEDVLSKTEIENINTALKKGDFIKTQEVILKSIDLINKKDKKVEKNFKQIKALQYLYVNSVLNEGTYTYKEKEKADVGVKYIQDIMSIEKEFTSPFYDNYYLGYASEITKNYSGALMYYNEALKAIGEDSYGNILKSILVNQIGHVLDLEGKKEEAISKYTEAYTLNNKNYKASINIARYFTRTGDFEKAKSFFSYALKSKSSNLLSEIYFSLSSIELEIGGLNPDIQKSIDYAKLSIAINDKYPMGYLALARGYYMLNNKNNENEIVNNLNTSISLNPNGNEAYKYMALYYFDKKDYENAFIYLEKAKSAIDMDIILMEEQRIQLKYLNDLLGVFMKTSASNIELVYDLYTNEKLKPFIKSQIKRKNYGIYEYISNEENFKKIVTSYNN